MDWMAIPTLFVAAVLGAIVGLEREIGAQPAGLRTHMLVSMGAALFTMAGADVLGSDPTRVAAQVVTGIGFLGGGAIFKEGINMRGLTTAAALWVTAAIGLATGLRMYWASIAVTLFAVGILWLFKVAEMNWLPDRHRIQVILTLVPDASLEQVEREALDALVQARVLRIDYAGHDQSIVLTARADNNTSLPAVAERLRHLAEIQGVEVSR